MQKETFEGNKALSKEASVLVDKFRKGLDGGIGGHGVFKGVSELRGKSGARIYYRGKKKELKYWDIPKRIIRRKLLSD